MRAFNQSGAGKILAILALAVVAAGCSVQAKGTGDAGPQGPIGPQGPQGLTGAQGPMGPPGLVWRGVWDATASYAVNDAVSSSGSAYIAINANTNSPPPSIDWSLLAAQGTQGPPGPQGPVGPSAAFKNVLGQTFVNLTSTGQAIASITFTAPSAGAVFAIGTGYCNLNNAPNVVYAQIDTTSGTVNTTPLQNLFITENSTSPPTQFPIVVSKTFTVAAGTQTLYLNAKLTSGTSTSTNCQTNMTVFFTATTLP